MAGSISRKQGRSFLVGVAALGVIAVVSYVAATAQQGLPLTSHTVVRAAFTDVGQLNAGDDVRQNSLRIGDVRSIDYRNGHAVVTMQLSAGQKVYRNARAALWDQSALGQKFVELEPGDASAGRLGSATIQVTHTESADDLDQLFDVFTPATRSALQTAVGQLGTGMAGQSAALHDFLAAAPDDLHDVRALAAAASSTKADLTGLLVNAELLARQFKGRDTEITQLLDNADTTLRAAEVDNAGPLGRTIALLPGTLAKVHRALNALDAPLHNTGVAMAALEPGAQALGQATPDLRGVLTEAPAVLAKIPGVARKAGPAVEDLTTTFTDARPLVPRLDEGLADLSTLLTGLAPYAVDLSGFLRDGASLTGDGVGDHHYLRLAVGPINTALLGGITKLPADPYPVPGQAPHDRANSLTTAAGGSK